MYLMQEVASLLYSSSSVKSHLDEVLGSVEVLVSGRVVSFFTHQENLLNRVGDPGIVAASDNFCSNNIEDSLEEIIQREILNLDEFYFLMIKKFEVRCLNIKAKL